jgi:hypothetical protein
MPCSSIASATRRSRRGRSLAPSCSGLANEKC